MSQTELAGKLKVTRTYLSLVESGKKNPSMHLLRHTSDVLGVPVPVLFVEEAGPDKAVMNELHKVLAHLLTAKAEMVAGREKDAVAART